VLGALLATVGLLSARNIAPGRRAIELDVYVLVLGVMALPAMISWLRHVAPPERKSRLAAALEPRAPELPRIPELDRLERELNLGASRDFDLHYRLRPVIREIALGRLDRRGLRLDSGSEAVRELLGDDLWKLVRPDREPPRDRQAPGPGLAEVRQTVERLERL
jgi:hypothetical protein